MTLVSPSHHSLHYSFFFLTVFPTFPLHTSCMPLCVLVDLGEPRQHEMGDQAQQFCRCLRVPLSPRCCSLTFSCTHFRENSFFDFSLVPLLSLPACLQRIVLNWEASVLNSVSKITSSLSHMSGTNARRLIWMCVCVCV